MAAIPFIALFGGALLMLLVAYSVMLVKRPLEEVADRLGWVGYLLRAVIGVTYAIIMAPILVGARAADAIVGRWLNSVAVAIRTPLAELRAYTNEVEKALSYIAVTLVPTKIRAATNGIRDAVDAVDARADRIRADLTTLTQSTAARLTDLRLDLQDFAIDKAAVVRAEVADLRRDLPGEVTRIAGALAAAAVAPFHRVLDVDLPRIYLDLSGLRRLLDEAREWVTPLSLAFSAAAVIDLLTHVRHCRRKTEKLCDFDMDAFDDLLGLAFVLPSLPLIVEAVRFSATHLDEIMPDLADTLR